MEISEAQIKNCHSERIFAINNVMSVSLLSVQETCDQLGVQQQSVTVFHIDNARHLNDVHLSTLARVTAFTIYCMRILKRNPEKSLVICLDSTSTEAISRACVLLGSFLILGQGEEYQAVVNSFCPMEKYFVEIPSCSSSRDNDQISVSVQDCWRAIHHASRHGWIDQSLQTRNKSRVFSKGSIDIDAYSHYSQIANGGVFTVVPGKVLVFPRPHDLIDNLDWMDSPDGKDRHFAPRFFADLFSSEFAVSVVGCLGYSDKSAYDRQAFRDYGIDAEVLSVSNTSSHLQVLDRFLTIARAIPGMIALDGGRRDAAGLTGSLVMAYLIREVDFDEAAAVAWILMVCPQLLVSSTAV